MKLKIFNFDVVEEILGPFKRAVIWTQGCPFRCENCMTPEGLSLDGGVDIDIKYLAEKINSLNIEGITISGGEPFLQSKKLIELVKLLKNLGVIVYTGYEYEEIKNDEFLNYIDILIDGKYIEELNDGIAYRGSSNQNVYILSDRYKDFETLYNSHKRKVLIKDGFIYGMPSKKTFESLKNGIYNK